jgi:hypothetical protein
MLGARVMEMTKANGSKCRISLANYFHTVLRGPLRNQSRFK